MSCRKTAFTCKSSLSGKRKKVVQKSTRIFSPVALSPSVDLRFMSICPHDVASFLKASREEALIGCGRHPIRTKAPSPRGCVKETLQPFQGAV